MQNSTQTIASVRKRIDALDEPVSSGATVSVSVSALLEVLSFVGDDPAVDSAEPDSKLVKAMSLLTSQAATAVGESRSPYQVGGLHIVHDGSGTYWLVNAGSPDAAKRTVVASTEQQQVDSLQASGALTDFLKRLRTGEDELIQLSAAVDS